MKLTPVAQPAAQPAAQPVIANGSVAAALAPFDELEIIEPGTSTYQQPLIVSTYGDEGTGKSSRLIGTAPGDIGLVPMDNKSRGSVLATAAEFGRRVVLPTKDFIRTANAMLISVLPAACVTEEQFTGKGWKPEDMTKAAAREMERMAAAIRLDDTQPECCQTHYYRWHVNQVKAYTFRLAAMDNVRTIGIDPFGQFVEDTLFACYGRNEKIMPLDRKSFNQEVRDFLNAISHKNLVLTHHSATVWVENKPTNRTKPANSFSKIGHYTSVAVCQTKNRNPRRDPATGELMDPVYKLQVMDCTANAPLSGMYELTDENVTFSNLAMAVYPDSEFETWE